MPFIGLIIEELIRRMWVLCNIFLVLLLPWNDHLYLYIRLYQWTNPTRNVPTVAYRGIGSPGAFRADHWKHLVVKWCVSRNHGYNDAAGELWWTFQNNTSTYNVFIKMEKVKASSNNDPVHSTIRNAYHLPSCQ